MFTSIMRPVWVLNDHARTSHAGDIRSTVLGGHRHPIPAVARYRVRVRHVVPAPRHRVHHLLSRLDVHRHGLWVPILNGLRVRPVRVAVSTRRDSHSGGLVLHSRADKSGIKGSTISIPRPVSPEARGVHTLDWRVRGPGRWVEK